MKLGINLGISSSKFQSTVITQAIAILRRPGITASVYLPGIGSLSGLQAANYLLSDGSTGLTTVDGPVGLVLDAMGSETQLFNAVGVTTAGPSLTGLNASLNTTAGKTYKVTYTVTALVGQLSSAAGGTSGLAQAINWTGTYSEMLVAVTTGFTQCGLITRGIGVTSVTGSVTVTEVTGIHATQPTTAAKPRLERGVRNLLTYSQDFTNAAWSKNLLTGTPAYGVGPDGITPAYRLQGTDGNGRVTQSVSLTVGATYTELWWVKSNTSPVSMRIQTQASNGVDVFTAISVTTEWALYASNPITITASGAAFGLRANSSLYDVSIFSAGIFQGTLTAAQILAEGGIPLTTTAAASNPNAGKYSWAFDGGDSLSLGSVPFQMSDDHFVIAGFRADLTAASCLFSIGSTASNSPMCVLDISAGGYRSLWRDDAAVQTLLGGGTYVAGTPAVVSMRSVSSTRVLRVNGSQAATNTTVLGATTFNVSKIGAQARTTDANFHTGSTGPIISGKGTLTDSEMLSLERLVANLTPNAPSF